MANGARWRRFRSWPFCVAVAALGLVSCASAGDDARAATSTTAPSATSTITTATTDLGAVPDPDAPVPGYTSAPARTGGLTTFGAGTFSVDELLGRLTVAPATEVPGYDRTLFEHWIDSDGNGCDTRAEVLRSESITPAQVDPSGCHVLTGDWLSIYDGFTTDDPTDLDIDHLVALGEAWRSGASTWSPERRQAFANDLGHPGALVAVTAATNRSKGDRDPAVWQPPNRSAWCLYTADWITVKARWKLTADPAEMTALRNMLRGCGGP